MSERAAWQGPHDPSRSTPPRRPGSARRSTAVDVLRPWGIDGDVLLHGTGRDLVTRTTDSLIAATAQVDARVDGSRSLVSLVTDPPVAGITPLLGARLRGGFRGLLAEALDPSTTGSALAALLDDLPSAFLIGGYARMRERAAAGRRDDEIARQGYASKADICAGWRTGSHVLITIESGHDMPVPVCPPAPPLTSTADPQGWHRLDPLPPGSLRRRRLIDVTPAAGTAEVVAMFRDSYWDLDGDEVVLHEWSVTLSAETARWMILTATARPHVLPYGECPSAAASAAQLVGTPCTELRRTVRDHLSGPIGCTHLNDVFRALADVPSLAARVEQTAIR